MKLIKNLKYLLVLAIALPVFVSAETVAKIGDNEYETLEAAITAATTEGAEIVLQADYTITEYMAHMDIPEDKNIVINLNEHTLSGRTTNNGTVTIKNGKLVNNTSWGSSFLNDGTAIFNDVEVLAGTGLGFEIVNNAGKTVTINSGIYVSAFANKGGTMVVNGGTFTEDGHHNYLFGNSGTLTVNGGTFTTTEKAKNMFENTTYAVGIGGTSSLTSLSKIIVNDGTFNPYYYAFVNSIGGTSLIEFNGGTINSNSTEDVIASFTSVSENPDNFAEGTSGGVAIYGGTINAPNSKGIFVYSNNKLIIGKNDGTVTKDSPLINIPKGTIGSGYYDDLLEFYDGTIIQKGEIIRKASEGTGFHAEDVTIPEGYFIKYDKNEDGSLTAYLSNTSATPASDVEETPAATEDIKNPNTGMFISLVVTSALLVSIMVSIVVIKKKNRLYKI